MVSRGSDITSLKHTCITLLALCVVIAKDKVENFFFFNNIELYSTKASL